MAFYVKMSRAPGECAREAIRQGIGVSAAVCMGYAVADNYKGECTVSCWTLQPSTEIRTQTCLCVTLATALVVSCLCPSMLLVRCIGSYSKTSNQGKPGYTSSFSSYITPSDAVLSFKPSKILVYRSWAAQASPQMCVNRCDTDE